MCVLFYFPFVCLDVCAYAFQFKVHCGSAFEPGASRLPYYCTPPACVPDVIGALAVWQQSQKKKTNEVGGGSNRRGRQFFSCKAGDFEWYKFLFNLNFVPDIWILAPLQSLCHVRTSYIVRYTSSTTHPSQPTNTSSELPKNRKEKKWGKKNSIIVIITSSLIFLSSLVFQ